MHDDTYCLVFLGLYNVMSNGGIDGEETSGFWMLVREVEPFSRFDCHTGGVQSRAAGVVASREDISSGLTRNGPIGSYWRHLLSEGSPGLEHSLHFSSLVELQVCMPITGSST